MVQPLAFYPVTSMLDKRLCNYLKVLETCTNTVLQRYKYRQAVHANCGPMKTQVLWYTWCVGDTLMFVQATNQRAMTNSSHSVCEGVFGSFSTCMFNNTYIYIAPCSTKAHISCHKCHRSKGTVSIIKTFSRSLTLIMDLYLKLMPFKG